MKPYLYLHLAFLLLFSFRNAFAQQPAEVKGTVTDSLKRPLPGVHIIVRNSPDSVLLAFTATNNQGAFSVMLPQGQHIFECRMVGYKTQHKTLSIASNAKPTRLEVMLLEDEQQLDEVVIEGQKAVVSSQSDTLVYNAADFSAVGDEKAVDILRRLPGIDVREDGGIYYKGVRIKDLLIEGESLFGKSPETLSRAFPADAIHQVQVLENYTAFGSRKNAFAEDAAINITLNEDKKQVVFGEATAGAGCSQKFFPYRMKSNAFLVGRKVKALWMNDFNNTGQHIFDIKSYLSFVGFEKGLGQSLQQLPIAQDPTTLPPSISTGFSALSLSYSPNDKLKMRGYAFFNQNRQLGDTEIRRYFPGEKTVVAYSKYRLSNLLAALDQTLTYMPDNRHTWTANLQVLPSTTQSFNSTQIIFGPFVSISSEQSRTKQYDYSFKSNYLWTISEKDQLDAETMVAYIPRRNQLSVFSNNDLFFSVLPNDIFGESAISLDSIKQHGREASWRMRGVLRQQHLFNQIWSMESFVGYEGNWDASSLLWEKELPKAFNSSNHFRTSKTHLSSFLMLKKGRLRVKAGATAAYYQLNFEGVNNRAQQQRAVLMPETDVELRLPFSQTVKMSYALANNQLESAQINESYVIEGRQGVRRGSSNVQIMPVKRLQVNYNLSNLYSGLFFYAMAMYEDSPKNVGMNQNISLATLQEYAQLFQRSTTIFMNMSKAFRGAWPFTAKANWQWSKAVGENKINGIASQYENISNAVEVSAFTYRKKALNVEGKWSYKHFVGINSLSEASFVSSVQRLSGKMIWQASPKMLLNLQAERMLFSRGEMAQQAFFFCNAFASYQLHKKVGIQLEGFNILNTNKMQTAQMMGTYQEQEAKPILGRYVLASMVYKF